MITNCFAGTTPLEVLMIQGDLTRELESLSPPFNQLGDIRDFGEAGDEKDFDDFLLELIKLP
jgi:hypothetical protein